MQFRTNRIFTVGDVFSGLETVAFLPQFGELFHVFTGFRQEIRWNIPFVNHQITSISGYTLQESQRNGIRIAVIKRSTILFSQPNVQEMEADLNKHIYELEYTKLEIAEILTNLNKLMANYQIFSHKLRNFYWNVVGQDYFDLRQHLNMLYERVNRHLDEIAERIRIFNQAPPGLLQDIIELSTIKENGDSLAGFEMAKETLQDIKILLSLQQECIEKAVEVGDYGTEQMVKIFIYELEKDHRVLLSWLK